MIGSKIHLWLILFVWALAGVAPAKSPVFSPQSTPVPEAFVKPFLWSVTKGKQQSYILGTVHVGISAKAMPASVWDALRDSKAFVSEADTSTVNVAAIRKYLYYTPPQTLTKALGLEKTKTVAKALGSTVDAIQAMRPWFVSSLLILKLEPNKDAMLDSELQKAAARQKKDVRHLETYEEQVRMIAGLDEKMMLDSLYDVAADMEKARADYQEMTRVYKAGDEKKLEGFMRKEMAKVAGMETELLQKRNANWVPKLEGLFAKGPTFVAVGAAHLVGPGSVVDRLRKKGYTVKRMP